MLKKLFILCLVGAVGVGLLWAAPDEPLPKYKLSYKIPVRGGADDPEINAPVAPSRPVRHTLDDYIGVPYFGGTTWYDYQHNGSAGKMVDVDDAGIVSIVWMNGLDEGATVRRIYYNVWDPMAEAFMYDTIGILVDASSRAGYVAQTTNADGFCFPAFHQSLTPSGIFHSAASIDYAAYSDAYTTWEPAWCYEGGSSIEIIWPKIAMDINGILHMISTENPASGEAGDPQRIYYSRGVPEFDNDGFGLDIVWDDMSCGGVEVWDTVMTIAPDVACSRHSERVAIAWCHSMEDLSDNPSQWDNEIYLRVSEDGGLNWGERINVTQWVPWDPECWYTTGDIRCNRDTMRAYTDCSILLDEDDFIHIAFTTPAFWWYLPDQTDSGYITPNLSRVWHWSEETHDFSQVADGWYSVYTNAGAWNHNAQRPSLAIDPSTDYLYCSYVKHDTLPLTENSFMNADAYVTVSTNGGCSWAVGTNVTDDNPDIDPIPTGQSMHQRDVTIAELVSDGYVHMEYVLDKDAGGMPQTEGVWTLNPVYYQRIPVDAIAALPYMENYPMHWDSTGRPPDECYEGTADRLHGLPVQFLLYQNYPNPFNPTTMLHFDLAQRGNVTLKVYNVLGQEVAALINDAPLLAGTHQVEFDGSDLASGIYIYTLTSNGYVASKKMVLMK